MLRLAPSSGSTISTKVVRHHPTGDRSAYLGPDPLTEIFAPALNRFGRSLRQVSIVSRGVIWDTFGMYITNNG
jgi:hypothetical protein